MTRAVIFDEIGSVDALRVVDVPDQHAGEGEVRVRVKAAGLNPVDWKIIENEAIFRMYGADQSLPSGNGNDFAGVVDEVGDGVTDWAVGDEVYGGSRFHAQADHVIVASADLLAKPDGLSMEQAGSLDIVGRTAMASVRTVGPSAGDTVLVSAAAGGVGVLAAQLAGQLGATVIGTASESNHEYLRDLGVIPIAYGDGLIDRLREVAPSGIDAVLDNAGRETLEIAVELGVPMKRVNTIAARPYAAEIGCQTVGGADAGSVELDAVGQQIAAGTLSFPIDSTYPMERVIDAYERLRGGHLRGKVVLTTE